MEIKVDVERQWVVVLTTGYREARVRFREPTAGEISGWRRFAPMSVKSETALYDVLKLEAVNEPTAPKEREIFVQRVLLALFDHVTKV